MYTHVRVTFIGNGKKMVGAVSLQIPHGLLKQLISFSFFGGNMQKKTTVIWLLFGFQKYQLIQFNLDTTAIVVVIIPIVISHCLFANINVMI